MSDEKRTCTMCVFCLRDDYGYSNYTVEGTTLECLAGLNPEMNGREDEQWDEARIAELAPILDYAKTCPRFRAGAPATLDVDREAVPLYWTTDEQKTLTAEDFVKAGYTDDIEVAALLLAREAA